MKRLADMIVSLCLGLVVVPSMAQDAGCLNSPHRRSQLAAQDAAQLQELQEAHGPHDVTPRTREVFERLVRSQRAQAGSAERFGWRLTSYASGAINAHAMHGGGVVISAGLDAPELPDDAVAAGLAHEMAHVLLGHSMERVCLALRLPVAVPAADGQPGAMPQVWSSDDDAGHRMRALMHTQELQADAKAVELLRSAGFPAHAMSNLLRRLASLYSTDTQIEASTHPDHRMRITEAVAAEQAAAAQTAAAGSSGSAGEPARR
jgi:predicted Zn-dependent protease